MIKLSDIMTDEQKAILKIFDPAKIEETQKEIDDFNKKTDQFLEAVKNIEIKFNF